MKSPRRSSPSRSLPLGCIRAPEIVLVDRATALEQQAAGSYAELERKLARAAMAPRPAPLTPEQLEALGIPPPPLVDDTERTDADRVDALLAQHCLGEARDGALADTHDACKGAADRAQSLRADRAHQPRAPAAVALDAGAQRRPRRSLDDVRRAWQKTHARGVVCGGWIQRDDGTWEARSAEARRSRCCCSLLVAADARAQGDDDVVQRPERLTAGVSDQFLGQLAPDGHTLYFVSNRNTTNEIYRAGPGDGRRQAALRRRRRRHLAARQPRRQAHPLHLVPRRRRGAAVRARPARAPAPLPRRTPARAAGAVDRRRAHRARQPRLARRATCASCDVDVGRRSRRARCSSAT